MIPDEGFQFLLAWPSIIHVKVLNFIPHNGGDRRQLYNYFYIEHFKLYYMR